jgi:hypothetical protein
MHAAHDDALIFHLGGTRHGDALRAIDGLELRPALLAPYRDLGVLRHDFPAVLVRRDGAPDGVCSLSSLVDTLLIDVAPRGIEGERLRRHALQLETQIRRAVDAGAGETLAQAWQASAARLGAREGVTLEQVLCHAGGALRADGELVGCTGDMPARLITHAWQAVQRDKARRFEAERERLVRKLTDILRASFIHSAAGRQPQALEASLGGPHREAFDFDVLSRLVAQGVPREGLTAARRERLTRTLEVLGSQRFFAAPGLGHEFAFDSCAAAVRAFRERLPQAAQLVKAIAIAELEVQGRYDDSRHDPMFDAFDEGALTPEDLARLPDYLVCIPPERSDAPENADLIGMLSSGLPVKVLVQPRDLMEDALIGAGRLAFGVRSARLATAAMGLGGLFVLQTPSANLVALREQVHTGLACRGPALFSVFPGLPSAAGALPTYLSAAAAMTSRAFPAFCYDAKAGESWATRFSLLNNPQPEVDWPVETLEVADEKLQRVRERCAFTLADFLLCDPACAAHFALVPRESWSEALMPAAEWLLLPDEERAQRVPYLLAVDRDDTLQRVLVDARLMEAARRSRLLWRRLQEHGGLHDDYAQRLLAREKAAWEAALPATPAPASASASPEAAPAEHSRDEAWIDTARCPSCNECQLINDRMFGYDEHQQAFIKDLAAGTYRQLVEAAESCQVAIIHPGKPRDPSEPGLEELLLRAHPFR